MMCIVLHRRLQKNKINHTEWFYLLSRLIFVSAANSNVTFHYRRSSAAYFAGVCSSSRGVGVNEVSLPIFTGHCTHLSRHKHTTYGALPPQYGNTWTMAASLLQSLAQNLGIQWDPAIKRSMCLPHPSPTAAHVHPAQLHMHFAQTHKL